MIIVIFLDIVGASTIGRPIFGGGEIVAITQLLAISLALPTGLFQDIFPAVTLLTDLFGPRMKTFFAVLNSIVCLVLFSLITCVIFKMAYEYQESDELIANINLPLYPFLYIAGFAFIISCMAWVLRCVMSLNPSATPTAKGGDL
ncbi:MAG: TRAP transporter small permease subunit [Deltaproteobacteria bacterium]|nr:TRAP transporter small permease subunit [Deltaproteobacteria bacterium]